MSEDPFPGAPPEPPAPRRSHVRRRGLLIGATVAVLAVIAGALVIVVPSGSDSASEAAVDHVEERADRGTAEVLAEREWGDGSLVLVGYERDGVRRLGLGFAAEGFRGWRFGSYTEKPVEPDDVVVGSLLVASSPGAGGQPAWSAAVGELLDARIDRVEVKWASGEKALAPRMGDAYLVVQRGATMALEARYLADDGAEIAKVPIADS